MREIPRILRSGCVRTELCAFQNSGSSAVHSYEATGNLAIFPAKVAASWFSLEGQRSVENK